jgi:hypothetical protein
MRQKQPARALPEWQGAGAPAPTNEKENRARLALPVHFSEHDLHNQCAKNNQLGERPSGKGREHPPRRTKENLPLSIKEAFHFPQTEVEYIA